MENSGARTGELAEFFDLAWPVKPQPPTPPTARLQSLLRRFQPAPLEPRLRDELTRLVREALAGTSP